MVISIWWAGNIARAPITYEGIVHQAWFVSVGVLIGKTDRSKLQRSPNRASIGL